MLSCFPRKHATHTTHSRVSSIPPTPPTLTRMKFLKLNRCRLSYTLLSKSRLILHSCSYFQGFQGQKLQNGCLVVCPSEVFLRFLRLKIDIYEFRCIFRLAAILRLLEGKTLFALICSFYCC